MEFTLTGRFLGTAVKTAKGYIRQFLSDDDKVYRIFSKDATKLDGNSVDIDLPDFLFAS
ncbi:hypothetical protein [uncultured Desulfuromonas sp.]|uniref:hypothetical protein n=1 Tax=uncultured Desulfuromonas sp. TaxID=181013 RepID=UPI002AAC3ED8|nr:hypothetical protein [uncultured Desulfuromonas sp.]